MDSVRDVRNLIYSVYERRLLASLAGKPRPHHVGLMCDGNRRWAREMGYVDPNDGHRVGAVKIKHVLEWCEQAGIGVVTLYLLGTENLRRPAAELDPLLQIIEDLAGDLAAPENPWQLHPVGALDVLPTSTAEALKKAEAATADRTGGMTVNMAVGYGGRREIADAVRSLLHEHASTGGTHRGAGRRPRRRAHRQAPLHQGPARSGPGHPYQRRAAAVRVPAVAVGALGVLLLRRELAGVPAGRLPAGVAVVRESSAAVRSVAENPVLQPERSYQPVARSAAALL